MTTLFHYTARAADGRFVAGSLDAPSYDAALGHLRARSLFITSLAFAGTARGATTALFALLPVDRAAQTAFFRAFATLVRAGIPIRRALDVTTHQCRDRRLAEALRSISAEIEG